MSKHRAINPRALAVHRFPHSIAHGGLWYRKTTSHPQEWLIFDPRPRRRVHNRVLCEPPRGSNVELYTFNRFSGFVRTPDSFGSNLFVEHTGEGPKLFLISEGRVFPLDLSSLVNQHLFITLDKERAHRYYFRSERFRGSIFSSFSFSMSGGVSFLMVGKGFKTLDGSQFFFSLGDASAYQGPILRIGFPYVDFIGISKDDVSNHIRQRRLVYSSPDVFDFDSDLRLYSGYKRDATQFYLFVPRSESCIKRRSYVLNVSKEGYISVS